jgi:enterochelin esterase-like enzyme
MRELAGISRGGVWALEIALRHPEQFRAAAALSPSLALNYPRAEFDPFRLADAGGELRGGWFLGAGEADWARPKTEELGERLQDYGAEVRLEIVPGAHEANTWMNLFVPMLRFLQD